MVAELPGPRQAALRTLSTGAGDGAGAVRLAESRVAAAGTLSDVGPAVSGLPAAGGAVYDGGRLSGMVSGSSRGMVSTVSARAMDPVSPGAARLSEAARAVLSVSVVCPDAAGGAIRKFETARASARTMWCQDEDIEA